MARVAVALAAESVGVAQRMMEVAVAYAKDRKQFGQPIGVNQAVSHQCAQMLLRDRERPLPCYYAAWTADHEPESLALRRVVGQGLRLRRRLERHRLRRSRCTAASASPGSTTCISSSSGRGSTPSSTGPRASIATAWPT